MKLNTPNFYNYVIDNVTTDMHVFYEFPRRFLRAEES